MESTERKGVFAVMRDCGHIGGNGKTVAGAIITWNDAIRAELHKGPT